jgi:hypothetical protein
VLVGKAGAAAVRLIARMLSTLHQITGGWLP